MKKQFTIPLLILGIFFIASSIFYLWLLMFHLKLNPDMLRKYCFDSNSLKAYLKASQLLNKQPGESVSTEELDQIRSQLPPKEYHCSRQPIFERTK